MPDIVKGVSPTAAAPQFSPEIDAMLDRLIESQPPGEIGPRIVEAAVLSGAALSLAQKDIRPILAVGIGIIAATEANTLNALVGHYQAAHGSFRSKPVLNEPLRVTTALFGGIRMRAAAMHRRHHEHTDTSDDPHAPSVIGRGRVFRDIIGISDRFAKLNPEYVSAFEEEGIYTAARPYEKTPLFLLSVFAAHQAVGHRLQMTQAQRLVSMGLHLSLVYTNNAMFTADVHPDGEEGRIQNFRYQRLHPVMNVIFGSQANHRNHHEDPSTTRNGPFDFVHLHARIFKRLGLTEPTTTR